MAHQKTTAAESLLEREEARGVFSRRIEGATFIIANARTNNTDPNKVVADIIPGETSFNKGIFVAPCNGKVLGVKFAGLVLPHIANDGTCTVDVKKAVIGGTDVSLLSATQSICTRELEDCGYAHTGGTVFVDETAESNQSTANDVLICAAAGPASDDIFYVGCHAAFDGIVMYVSTAGGGMVTTGVWEYWNGSAYTFFPVEVDETEGFDSLGTVSRYYRVSWKSSDLTDWAADDIGSGNTCFHVRYRFTGVTTHTTHPLLQQLWVVPSGWWDWGEGRYRTAPHMAGKPAWPDPTLAGYGGTAMGKDTISLSLSTTTGALDLIEGQEVYLTVALANKVIAARSDGLRVEVEWMPTEV